MCVATDNRDFKGIWIPRTIWLDDRLNALDKVILAEIDSLDQGERGCYASNQHIADFCQCSVTKVSTAVSKLIDLNYLYVQNYDGRQRELKSRLSNFERQTFKNRKADSQKLKESNTGNKPSNNTSKKKNKAFIAPSLEEVEKYCKERKNNVDAKRFYDYFTASNWIDSTGKPVRNWKQKIITWEGYTKKEQDDGQTTGDTTKVRYSNIV